MPVDASNSQFWNPVSITDLSESELDLNAQASFPHIRLNSSLPAGALAPNFPPTNFSGRVDNNQAFYLGSSLGFVKKIEQSPWTAGILAASTFGAGVHYRQSDNPITSPPPPEGFGRGDIKATGELFYVAPTIARRFGEHWSAGLQPIIATFL